MRKIKTKILLIAIFMVGFLFSCFFTSFAKAADTSGANYCSDDIRKSDQSEIDLITVSASNRVKKGDKFIILIQNDKNDFATTYSVDILKNGSSVSQKTGSLDSMLGSNNIAQIILTADFDIADYAIKTKLYHKDKHCLVKMKEMSLQIIATDDFSTPDGVELFDHGEVKIGSPDKQIKAGGVWRVTIKNNFTADFKFEVKINDLTTGNFLTKTAGTVKAGDSVGAWATIMTAGDHIAEVDILNFSSNALLYTQRFNVTVTQLSTETGKSELGTGSGYGSSGQLSSTLTEAVTPEIENAGVGVGVQIPGSSATSYTFSSYMCAIYYWALNIGFGLTLLMFIYAGYRYMTAAGNDSVFTDTKDILTSAILGFLLLLMIRLVLHVLNVPEPDKCFTNPTAAILNHLSLVKDSFSIR